MKKAHQGSFPDFLEPSIVGAGINFYIQLVDSKKYFLSLNLEGSKLNHLIFFELLFFHLMMLFGEDLVRIFFLI